MDIEKMWDRLTQHQSYADQRGYGEAWTKMHTERTREAALNAAKAASDAADVVNSLEDEDAPKASMAALAAVLVPITLSDELDTAKAKKVVFWIEKSEKNNGH